MSNTRTNKPAAELRDGNLRAVFWANTTPKGVRHDVELVRSYKDDSGNWHNSHSFS